MSTLVFLDLETTGLDPERHHIWEFGAYVRGHCKEQFNGEWRIEMRPNLTKADPMALRIGRFYERRSKLLRSTTSEAVIHTRPPWEKWPSGGAGLRWGEYTRMSVAQLVAEMLDGAHLVGCVPNFDAEFLSIFLRSHWQAPTWHYHLVDVEHLVVGYLAGERAGYNGAVGWLADAHNTLANVDAPAGTACQVPKPDLDVEAPPAPPWSSDELSRRIGLEPPGPDERHTALGDARWAMAIYDKVMGGPRP